MKRSIVILFAISVFAYNTFGKEESEKDERIPVQIRVISQLNDYHMGWSKAYVSPIDEFHHFSKALGKSMKPLEERYSIEFRRFPKKLDPDVIGVSLYLHDWKLDRGGIIDARFSAYMEEDGEKIKVGFFAGKSHRSIASISSLQDDSYYKAVQKAGDKFVVKLQPILDRLSEGE